jgi:hypothetical protein
VAEPADPVSWLLIEPGWRVVGSDGAELGRIEAVTGDDDRDIFDGLAVAGSVVAHPRYVASESVGEIVEGTVTLKLDGAAFEQLPEYVAPPEAVQIEPEKASVLERATTSIENPGRGRFPLLERISRWFGKSGQR